MNDVEDGLASRLMMSHDERLSHYVISEANSALPVQPLRLQPPTHIVFSYLENSRRRMEWLCRIPWRIEVG